MNFFRSVLLMPPMGLISARTGYEVMEELLLGGYTPEEQSYFVR